MQKLNFGLRGRAVFPAAWREERPSIYRHLASFRVDDGDSLPEDALTLPDEDIVRAKLGGGFGWAPGALDGAFGVPSVSQSNVPEMVALLSAAATRKTNRAVKAFYETITLEPPLAQFDLIQQEIIQRGTPNPRELQEFGRWLATESPDRNAVKVGISILGLVTPLRDGDLLLRLGLHDEFTLYIAAAMTSLPPEEAHEAWWWLARRVHGWGRVHLVEYLKSSTRDDIREWLLREGFKNSILFEYSAHTCAEAGNLVGALINPDIDEDLLNSAGEILSALISGGPAKDISDYEGGSAAAEQYIHRVSEREPQNPRHYVTISQIRDLVVAGQIWDVATRERVLASADHVLKDSRWTTTIGHHLDEREDYAFWLTALAADRAGVDAWPARFKRLKDGHPQDIGSLIGTGDAVRTREVVNWATSHWDLKHLGRGSAEDHTSLGKDGALGQVLNELHTLPGEGWELIEAGLHSPRVWNRNAALSALESWPTNHETVDPIAALTDAHRTETDAAVKLRMAALLNNLSESS